MKRKTIVKVEVLLDDQVDSEFSEEFFQKIAEYVLEHVDYPLDEAEISLVLCDDNTMKEINNRYRNIDKATDVLSFPLNDGEIVETLLGDIIIDIDEAKRYSEYAKIPLNREIAFLFVHGLLHLLGYDHEQGEEEEKIMYDLQEKILKILIDKKVCD